MARLLGAVPGRRLLHEALDPVEARVAAGLAVGGRRVDDAVAIRLVRRHLHHGHDRGVRLPVGVDELADAGPFGRHHVIGEDHRERLVAHQLAGHEDRVAQAQLLLLADVADLGQVADVAHPAQHLDVAAFLEQVLELVRRVEVVLDGPLLRAGHDDDLLDAGGHRLFHGVLDDRLVDQGQHLLGLRLGGGQEPGAPASGREDGFADAQADLGIQVVGGGQYSRGPTAVRAGWSAPAGCPAGRRG